MCIPRLFFVLLISLIPLASMAQEKIKVAELKGTRTAITPKLSRWKPDLNDPVLKIKTRDEKGLIFSRTVQSLKMKKYNNGSTGPDPVWQKRIGITEIKNSTSYTPAKRSEPITQSAPSALSVLSSYAPPAQSAVASNFDGITYTNISPADPTIAVGPAHIIQMVNGPNGSAYFKIFNKNGGQLTLEAYMDQLPGASYNGAGDCITWYDQLTDRFVMTEFGDSSRTGTAVNSLIMAVSASPDPLGSWYVYEFTDASFFPDYPKYSNWHDAWYGMTRDFTGSYIGNSVWAFDKTKMINGVASVTVQRIRLVDTDNKFNSLCPVSLAGNTPAPAGTPGLFLYFSDDEFTAAPSDSDSLGVVSFNVDFSNPSNSRAGKLQSIPVASFRSDVCETRSCAPSASGQGYDVVSNRMMNRPYYRNFGTHEAIVANHTVDATGTGIAGVRWYELRRSGGLWSTNQQGTFAPQDVIPCTDPASRFRFMGGITLNAFGQIGLAYNNSSATSFASIGYTGRNAADPLNAMSYEENLAFIGTGFGSFGNRWGDYSEIAPDPVNDSLFWFTGMYGTANGWGTRIFSFKLGKPKKTDVKLVAINKPNACESSCNTNIEPIITLRNVGTDPIHSLSISYQVNGGPAQVLNWTGLITSGEEQEVTLPATIISVGNGTFTVSLVNINGSATDDDLSNNTLSTATSIGVGITLPLAEGFENILFPSVGWSVRSNALPAVYWERNANASRSGIASAYYNNFDRNQPSKFSDLRTPLIRLEGKDSLELNFYYAGAIFDNDNVDTLEILVSGDCGNSFRSVWRKNTREIATREGNVNIAFIPTASEWRRLSVDLNEFASWNSIIVAFRNINGFGNMIYIDDINIQATDLPAADIAVAKIVEPDSYICDNSVKPLVAFTNLGRDTIRNASFMYSINGDVFRSMNWQGKLARKEVGYITLPETILSPGEHTITVLANLPGDANVANDSLRITFQVKEQMDVPLQQGFETSQFPPSQWNLANGSGPQWMRSTVASYQGQLSAYIHNYGNRAKGEKAKLVTPLMSYLNVDSIFLQFRLSAAGGAADLSSSTTDTLEIFISADCGKTMRSVYKKWGKQLQTISDAALSVVGDFIPSSTADWRKEKVDLSALLGRSNSFVTIFSNNSGGVNNIYLDDIEIFTKNVPPKLRDNGLLIAPNPFSGQFRIHHYPDAKGLTGVEVISGTGQVVYRKKASDADIFMEIDLSSKPAGIYFVKLSYKDKVVTQKLLKGY